MSRRFTEFGIIIAVCVVIAMTALGSRRSDVTAAETDKALPGRFGRMFQGLPPFAAATDTVRAALMEVGKPGGLMDARDDLAAGPIALIVDPGLSLHNPNNTTHTAGTTFMGQFLDHDMTFDTTSRLGIPTNPNKAPNARRAAGGPSPGRQRRSPQ